MVEILIGLVIPKALKIGPAYLLSAQHKRHNKITGENFTASDTLVAWVSNGPNRL